MEQLLIDYLGSVGWVLHSIGYVGTMVAGVAALVAAMRSLLRGAGWTLAISRRRRLNDRERYRATVKCAQRSDRAYYGQLWLFVLAVLMLLSLGALILPALAQFPWEPGRLFGRFAMDVPFFQGVIGVIAVLVAFGGARFHRDVQQYDTTIARLDRQIARLRAKLPGSHTQGDT